MATVLLPDIDLKLELEEGMARVGINQRGPSALD
jgi:hypothetical protein